MAWQSVGNIKGPPGTGGGAVGSVFGRVGDVLALGSDYAEFYEPLLGNPTANGYILSSTIVGVRSWIPRPTNGGGGGLPAGEDSQVQFNDLSAFGADERFVFNKATGTLSAPRLSAGAGDFVAAGGGLGGHMQIQFYNYGYFAFSNVWGFLLASGIPIGWQASGTISTGIIPDTTFTRVGVGVIKSNGSFDVATGYRLGGDEFPIAENGIVKRIGPNAYAPAEAGTDYEAGLGNPPVSGYVVSSTAAGVRSWVPQAGGNGGGAALIYSVFGRVGDVLAQAADYAAFHPSLAGSYADPSWITSLAWAKITGVPAFGPYEPPLSNPAENGYVLSSTIAGVRSWIALPIGAGGGNLHTGQILAPNGSNAAPSYSFATSPITGMRWTGSNWLFANQGADVLTITQDRFKTHSLATYSWVPGTDLLVAGDAGMARYGPSVVEVTSGAPTVSGGSRGDILTRGLRSAPVPFANAIAGPVEGTLQAFNNATMSEPGSSLAGGGSNHVLGYYNGAKWLVGVGERQPNSFHGTPADPAGRTGTVAAMAGIGGVCRITPAYSGKVLVIVSGSTGANVVNAFSQTGIRYGSGTAPANGAAATGTAIGSVAQGISGGTAMQLVPFSCHGIVSGLTIGTSYWFDMMQVSNNAAATAFLFGLSVDIIEL